MKTITFFLGIAVLAIFCQTSLFAQQTGNDSTRLIIIQIENVRNDKGNVLGMAKIPGVTEPMFQMVKAAKGAVTLELKGIHAESVEVSIFHDENGNYQLEMGERGPLEGYVTKKYKLKAAGNPFNLSLYYPVPPQGN